MANPRTSKDQMRAELSLSTYLGVSVETLFQQVMSDTYGSSKVKKHTVIKLNPYQRMLPPKLAKDSARQIADATKWEELRDAMEGCIMTKRMWNKYGKEGTFKRGSEEKMVKSWITEFVSLRASYRVLTLSVDLPKFSSLPFALDVNSKPWMSFTRTVPQRAFN